MARIIYSGLIESIRGSIAGTTFQKNRYGHTVKRKPNMVRPATPFQNRQKQLISRATKAWRELTDSVRDSWNTWASTYPSYSRFNPSAELSGYAVFVRSQVYGLLAADTIRTIEPSFTLNIDDTLSLSLARISDTLMLSPNSITEDESWTVLIFASRPFSDSQNFIGTKTRFIRAISNSDGAYNIASEYAAVFGVLPAVGQRVALRYIMFNDQNGEVKAAVSSVVVVAAS